MRTGSSALVLAALALAVAAGCASPPSPTESPAVSATPTPGPGDRLVDREAAIARAFAAAEIGGPFVVDEAIAGTYEALDMQAHNAIGRAPPEPSPDTAVWRVTFHGPTGSEVVLLAAADGSSLGFVVQGR